MECLDLLQSRINRRSNSRRVVHLSTLSTETSRRSPALLAFRGRSIRTLCTRSSSGETASRSSSGETASICVRSDDSFARSVASASSSTSLSLASSIVVRKAGFLAPLIFASLGERIAFRVAFCGQTRSLKNIKVNRNCPDQKPSLLAYLDSNCNIIRN